MAGTVFAAIDVGSYNVTMEIFSISKKTGLTSLTTLRQRLDLGTDTYKDRKISMESLEALVHILKDYSRAMKEFGVTEYRACAKSAFREARNSRLIQEQILKRTGIRIDVLSNTEQRFLGYKSIASRGADFQKIIEKGTAIIDVGGGSIQISIFDKDVLISTQNIPIGTLRITSRIAPFENETTHIDELLDQVIRKDILNFKRMFLKDRTIENIILVGDYFTNLIFQNRSDLNKIESREEFMQWYNKIISMTPKAAAEMLGVGAEVANAVIPIAVLYRKLIDVLGTATIYLPGIQLTDGITYDFAEKKKLIKSTHDFDKDILMASKNISKRYAGNKPHTTKLIEIANAIFDEVRKLLLLSSRDRLLLDVACELHDCGKYISLVNVAECSYNIIMSTEIIGLSDIEREIIANVVKYNTKDFVYFDDAENTSSLSEFDFLRVGYLTAILRLANQLDASYLQKVQDIRVVRKGDTLVIDVATNEDFTLERGLFRENVSFFEEMLNLKPELKVRKKI